MTLNLDPITYPFDVETVSYAYHLGYTHAKTGLDLWYGLTIEEISKRGLPNEFGEPDYTKGYEDAQKI